MRDPSGLKAAVFTTPKWPCRTAISLAVALPCIRARQIDQCGDLDMTNLRLVL
jgi:hypothetical protein